MCDVPPQDGCPRSAIARQDRAAEWSPSMSTDPSHTSRHSRRPKFRDKCLSSVVTLSLLSSVAHAAAFMPPPTPVQPAPSPSTRVSLFRTAESAASQRVAWDDVIIQPRPSSLTEGLSDQERERARVFRRTLDFEELIKRAEETARDRGSREEHHEDGGENEGEEDVAQRRAALNRFSRRVKKAMSTVTLDSIYRNTLPSANEQGPLRLFYLGALLQRHAQLPSPATPSTTLALLCDDIMAAIKGDSQDVLEIDPRGMVNLLWALRVLEASVSEPERLTAAMATVQAFFLKRFADLSAFTPHDLSLSVYSIAASPCLASPCLLMRILQHIGSMSAQRWTSKDVSSLLNGLSMLPPLLVDSAVIYMALDALWRQLQLNPLARRMEGHELATILSSLLVVAKRGESGKWAEMYGRWYEGVLRGYVVGSGAHWGAHEAAKVLKAVTAGRSWLRAHSDDVPAAMLPMLSQDLHHVFHHTILPRLPSFPPSPLVSVTQALPSLFPTLMPPAALIPILGASLSLLRDNRMPGRSVLAVVRLVKSMYKRDTALWRALDTEGGEMDGVLARWVTDVCAAIRVNWPSQRGANVSSCVMDERAERGVNRPHDGVMGALVEALSGLMVACCPGADRDAIRQQLAFNNWAIHSLFPASPTLFAPAFIVSLLSLQTQLIQRYTESTHPSRIDSFLIDESRACSSLLVGGVKGAVDAAVREGRGGQEDGWVKAQLDVATLLRLQDALTTDEVTPSAPSLLPPRQSTSSAPIPHTLYPPSSTAQRSLNTNITTSDGRIATVTRAIAAAMQTKDGVSTINLVTALHRIARRMKETTASVTQKEAESLLWLWGEAMDRVEGRWLKGREVASLMYAAVYTELSGLDGRLFGRFRDDFGGRLVAHKDPWFFTPQGLAMSTWAAVHLPLFTTSAEQTFLHSVAESISLDTLSLTELKLIGWAFARRRWTRKWEGDGSGEFVDGFFGAIERVVAGSRAVDWDGVGNIMWMVAAIARPDDQRKASVLMYRHLLPSMPDVSSLPSAPTRALLDVLWAISSLCLLIHPPNAPHRPSEGTPVLWQHGDLLAFVPSLLAELASPSRVDQFNAADWGRFMWAVGRMAQHGQDSQKVVTAGGDLFDHILASASRYLSDKKGHAATKGREMMVWGGMHLLKTARDQTVIEEWLTTAYRTPSVISASTHALALEALARLPHLSRDMTRVLVLAVRGLLPSLPDLSLNELQSLADAMRTIVTQEGTTAPLVIGVMDEAYRALSSELLHSTRTREMEDVMCASDRDAFMGCIREGKMAIRERKLLAVKNA
ncbi:unnamed protein product [Vitrella brassicaformis CCMP3155]|uniref:Uncharacterized protein n=3 Tax=Vitrella brassicaformis TaxID=1169539 RepID=A0A0G4EH36_VITBC|nr:unnamed protein product [Vitrella brassicaformis CCMP3155]|eukprot:CEL95784.1 unnamed protein product [Vitrella brassicaformis CCMP3155]